MSKHAGASYRPGDGIAHVFPDMDKERLAMTLTILECHFETMCDRDEQEIALTKKFRLHTMMTAVIKTIVFLPEFVLTLLLQGRNEAHAKYEMQCLYWAFICGKIDEKDVADGYSVLSLELIDRIKGS